MAGWSKWAQRAVWTVAALPFAFSITIGGPVLATAIALWLRRGGRRRDPPWRLRWFVGVSWLLLGAPIVLHVGVASVDAGVAYLERREFDSQAWIAGDRDVRTTMAHDLVESDLLLGADFESTNALLGPADAVDAVGWNVRRLYFGLDVSGYELRRGGFGYRDAVGMLPGAPMLVLEWKDDRVERASIGGYMKGRPLPAPRDDD